MCINRFVDSLLSGGMLFGIYTNRCLVMAAGVGLILGDLPTGLAMGAVGELAFMGFGVSQGGSVPPNPMGPGIVGTIIAITMKGSGIDVGSALALSFPFCVAFQFVITATYTFATTLTSYAYKALDRKNFKASALRPTPPCVSSQWSALSSASAVRSAPRACRR